jgi:hypothetical protein
MRRGQGTFVARVHGLEHVECLASTNLADDDPVRAHPQRVAHEITDGDFAPTLDVGWSRLERHHVWLRQPRLGRRLRS